MTALPALRDELALHPGPAGPSGAPSWTLQDPVRNRFFQLPWAAVEILARWKLGEAHAVARATSAETTLTVSARDVTAVAEFLSTHQLVTPVGEEATARLARLTAEKRSSWAGWLLHHYLFFRVPLVRPDRFLSATLGLTAWVYSRAFLRATAVALLAGLFLVGRQWDSFLATLVELLSWQGLACYGLAYIFVKTIHELGHAYTAKRYGCRVPTMGVAFLLLWPLLYTDTNEAWKLADRDQRTKVAAAGVAAELLVATWAMLAWSLLPDGAARSIAFLLATTTWVSSLVINLSPFLRFDGYFLLMDRLDMPNLHGRSFALARWKLREWLFALGEPPPERFARGRAAFLIAFAFATWAYRLLLFLGIAILVYHLFFKALGLLLFVVEIAWFILRPIWRELQAWGQRRRAILASRRSAVLLLALGGVLLLLALPWRGSVTAQAVIMADGYALLYAPGPAIVERIEVAPGEAVKAGQVLLRLSSPDLEQRLRQVEIRIRRLTAEAEAGTLSAAHSARRNPLLEALKGATAERAGLLRELERYRIAAPAAGRLLDLEPDLHSGQWVAGAEPLAALRGAGPPRIEGLLEEADIHRVAIGAEGRFFSDNLGLPALDVRVVDIERGALRAVDLPYLASVFGGAVPVREVGQELVPERAVYRLRLALTGDVTPPAMELRGTAHLDATAESPLSKLWKSVAVVLLRESGSS